MYEIVDEVIDQEETEKFNRKKKSSLRSEFTKKWLQHKNIIQNNLLHPFNIRKDIFFMSEDFGQKFILI